MAARDIATSAPGIRCRDRRCCCRCYCQSSACASDQKRKRRGSREPAPHEIPCNGDNVVNTRGLGGAQRRRKVKIIQLRIESNRIERRYDLVDSEGSLVAIRDTATFVFTRFAVVIVAGLTTTQHVRPIRGESVEVIASRHHTKYPAIETTFSVPYKRYFEVHEKRGKCMVLRPAGQTLSDLLN